MTRAGDDAERSDAEERRITRAGDDAERSDAEERRITVVNVINGPNLGRLGRREPEVYGDTIHDDLVAMIEREAAELGLKVVVRQSDSEAQLLDWIHAAADSQDPVILNAGGL